MTGWHAWGFAWFLRVIHSSSRIAGVAGAQRDRVDRSVSGRSWACHSDHDGNPIQEPNSFWINSETSKSLLNPVGLTRPSDRVWKAEPAIASLVA